MVGRKGPGDGWRSAVNAARSSAEQPARAAAEPLGCGINNSQLALPPRLCDHRCEMFPAFSFLLSAAPLAGGKNKKKKKRESICWWKCAAAAGMEPLDSGFSRRFREHLVASKSVLGMGKGIGKGMGKGSCAQLRIPSPGVVPARGENALPVNRGCALLPALPREGTGRAQLEGGRISGLSSRDDAALLDEGF